jgi:hypothetical protein
MTAIDNLDQGYRGLPDAAAGLYRALAWCPARFLDAHALAAIGECSVAETSALAVSLVKTELMRHAEAPGGAGLPIALDAAGHVHAAIVDGSVGLEEAASRWIEYLVGCAAIIDARTTPSHRPPFPGWLAPKVVAVPFGTRAGEGVAWLRGQLPNYLLVIRWAAGEGRFDLAYTFVQLLWPVWLWARPTETIEILELELAAAGATGSSYALSQMRTTLAGQLRGRPTDVWRAFALDQAAKQAAEQDGDERAVAQAVNGLGKDALAAGLSDIAEEYFAAAEAIRVELEDLRGAGLSRCGRARVAAERGHLGEALEKLREAHTMLVRSGDVFDTLLVAAEIGAMRARLGELGEGLAEIEAARAALEVARADRGQILVLQMQAGTLRSAGRAAAAAKARMRAADLLEALDPAGAARMREQA